MKEEIKYIKRKYSEKYVAYIDIMGFRDLVEKSIYDKSSKETIEHALQLFDFFRNTNERFGVAVVSTFSDCIVVSIDENAKGALNFLCKILIQTQGKLYKDKVLLRGGITKGKIVHTSKVVYGPALNEAFLLESKYAVYPRIIITKDVLKDYVLYNNYNFLKIKKEKLFIKEQYSEFYFVNHLYYEENMYSSKDDYYNTMKEALSLIKIGMKDERRDVQRKYNWLNNYYKNMINKNKDLKQAIYRLSKKA